MSDLEPMNFSPNLLYLLILKILQQGSGVRSPQPPAFSVEFCFQLASTLSNKPSFLRISK